MWAIGGSFPHDQETVGDRDPTVLLLVSSRIAIAVGILWCYVYDGRPVTNGSLLWNVYDARPITNGSLLRRLANRHTSVGLDTKRRTVVTSSYTTTIAHTHLATVPNAITERG